jgi:hypothetical protein
MVVESGCVLGVSVCCDRCLAIKSREGDGWRGGCDQLAHVWGGIEFSVAVSDERGPCGSALSVRELVSTEQVV